MSTTATGTECVAKCARNASGSLNASTLTPEDSSSRAMDFRTDASSSTTQTIGETSGTLLPCRIKLSHCNQTLVPGLIGGVHSAFCNTTISSATEVIPS